MLETTCWKQGLDYVGKTIDDGVELESTEI